jgi:hypothetical protein
MAEILVPPKAALEILLDACRLNSGGENALQARIRQLIEMGVTGLKRETVRARLRYGLTEMAQLGLATMLVNAQIPPAVAARIVREEWRKLVPFLIAGIAGLPERFQRLRPLEVGPYAFIEGNALAGLGTKSVRDARGGGPPPALHVFADLAEGMQVVRGTDSGTYVNSARFMSRIFELLAAKADVPEDIWDSLTRLRQSAATSPVRVP